MLVLCMLIVFDAANFSMETEVYGKVLAGEHSTYIVDFSKDASKRGFRGDYSHRLVPKDKCVRVKNNQ